MTTTSALRAACAVSIAFALVGAPGPAAAQELEPKAYSASPVGAAFLVLGFTRSTGSVVTDPTLPLTDVDAEVDLGTVALGYSFGLGGKLALVTAALPYSISDVSGTIFEDSVSITRSGLADARFKLSVNLRGNPAVRAREFARTPRTTIVGASVTVNAPTGQYYNDKLINLGTNRWSIKPEIGIAVPKGPWDLDAYFGAWFFTSNDDYFPGGARRTQNALSAFQGHASYTFRPRLWLAADATWYGGGDAQVDDGNPQGRVNNTRLGLTMSLPVGRSYSFKVAYSAGAIVRAGSDFRTFSIGFSRLWLTKL